MLIPEQGPKTLAHLWLRRSRDAEGIRRLRSVPATWFGDVHSQRERDASADVV
jgi:hypothetical protein